MTVSGFDPFGDPFRQMERLTSQLRSGRRTPMGMPMDVWQAEDGFHVALDLPGVDPSNVEITTEQSTLIIRGERSPEYGEGQNVLVAERPQGSFTRQLQVGETLDLDNVEASYSDGVLRLRIPMAQAAQPRRIQVQHRQSGNQAGDRGDGRRSDQGETVQGSVTSSRGDEGTSRSR
jgi:HSP20 family protein